MTDGKRNYIKPSSSQLVAVQLVVVVLVVILPLVVQQQQLKNCHLGIYQRKTTLGHKKKRPAGKLSSHCMKIWRCLPPERLGRYTRPQQNYNKNYCNYNPKSQESLQICLIPPSHHCSLALAMDDCHDVSIRE